MSGMRYKILLVAVLWTLLHTANAQSVDSIQTTAGTLTIRPVQHATFIMNINDETIYVDPTGGPTAFAETKPPVIILVTDIHGDHMDPKTIEAVKTLSTI